MTQKDRKTPEQMLEEVHAAVADSQTSFAGLKDAMSQLMEVVKSLGDELAAIKQGWHDQVIAALHDLEESGDAAALACNPGNEVEEPAVVAVSEPVRINAELVSMGYTISTTPQDGPGWERVQGTGGVFWRRRDFAPVPAGSNG